MIASAEPAVSQEQSIQNLSIHRSLMIAVLLVSFLVWRVAFETAALFLDRTKSTSQLTGLFLTCALIWLVWLLREFRIPRRRLMLGLSGLLLATLYWTGFRAGEHAVYPQSAQQAVASWESHARDMETIKGEVSEVRISMASPNDLLSLQSKLDAWKGHIRELERLAQRLKGERLPPFIAGLIDLTMESIAIDKLQIDNIDQQIIVIQAARDGTERASANEKLVALMAEEAGIEHQRERLNFGQRLLDVAKRTGY